MSLYRSCMPGRTGPKRRRRQSSDRPGSCPSPPPREPATPDNNNNRSQRTRGVKISCECYSETPRLEGCVRASTYRLVNLKDVQRRVEVRVELVYEHVEAGDLLRHGVRHLDQPLGIQCGDMNEQEELQLCNYLCCHVLTDGLNFDLDILDQQVELVFDELQSVHLVLPVLQCRHSASPRQQQSGSRHKNKAQTFIDDRSNLHIYLQKSIRALRYENLNLQV